MRAFGKLATAVTAAATLAVSSAALGQPPVPAAFDVAPTWLQRPDPDTVGSFYPVEAAMKHLKGSAKLRCTVTIDGDLKDCAVTQEAPQGMGFGPAALEIVAHAKMKPATKAGEPVETAVTVPFSFDAPPVMITQPDWQRKPSGEEFSRFYPVQAMKAGRGGTAKLRCAVSVTGRLRSCRVASEEPAGLGLGTAALSMSSLFVMTPMIVEEKPVDGGQVVIPIVFSCPGCRRTGPGIIGPTIAVYRSMPWLTAPTPAQVAAAYPPRAVKAEIDRGSVGLQCALKADGRLSNCEVTDESPEGRGFGDAALKLAADFQAPGDLKTTKGVAGSQVVLNIAFTGPGAAASKLTGRAQLVAGLTSAEIAAAFPARARDSKVAKGEAALACTVIDQGGHVTCAVKSETPKDAGFGEAALSLAGKLRVNPWSDEGLSTVGSVVTLAVPFTTP